MNNKEWIPQEDYEEIVNKYCKDCIRECKQRPNVEVVRCPIRKLKTVE